MIRPIEMTDTMAVFTRLVDPLDTRVELVAKERLERELAVLIFAEPLVVELFLRGRVCRPSRTGLPIEQQTALFCVLGSSLFIRDAFVVFIVNIS